MFVKMLEATPDYLIEDNTDAASISKIHALIAVDEILNLDDFSIEGRDFWQQVKTEIEKI